MIWNRFLVASAIALAAGCASNPEGLEVGEEALAKTRTLERMRVFDATSAVKTTTPTDTSIPVTHYVNNVSFAAKYLCSNHYTEGKASNVVRATRLEARLLKQDGSIACASNEGLREKVINEKKIFVKTCQDLPDGSYRFIVVDPDRVSQALSNHTPNLLMDVDLKPLDLRFEKSGSKAIISKAGNAGVEIAFEPFILYDINTDESGGGKGEGDKCDRRASPLVVDAHGSSQAPEAVRLSSPAEGILFNILGWNSNPSPHALKRISWIRNPYRYKFLVLPTVSGQVNGIDQMFGDNTRGPDGRFAENGFAALAKYDGMDYLGRRRLQAADGKIDVHDDIFGRLALWSDLNMDGKVQNGELSSLRDAGLIEIDLNYDPNFSEEDVYGNRTELKSLVRFSDGRERLVFDLWFRYLSR